jgi:hypothetical protein
MRLPCVECGVWFDIPEDKRDDFNIYHVMHTDGRGTELTPRLLCKGCTDKQLAKMNQQK